MTDTEPIPPGEEYLGVICEAPNCGMPIVFHKIDPNEDVKMRGAGVDLTCLTCSTRKFYPLQSIRRLAITHKH